MHQCTILAGGCFLGMQDLIRKQPGIIYRSLERRGHCVAGRTKGGFAYGRV
jgi:peptide methionine sulfoxide reductase MsrA